MPRLQMTEIAARLGVHKSTVSRQARRWGLVGEDGLVSLEAYQARRAADVDPALQTSGPGAAAAAEAPAPAPARAEGPSFRAERARKEAAQAALAEIELARKRGALIERAAVAATLGPLLRRLRDDLVAVPREYVLDPAQAAQCENAIVGLLERVSTEILTDGGASAAAAAAAG